MTYCYKYPRPAVTTDAVIFYRKNNETYILLIERGNKPYKGKWAFPGGFVDMDEDLPEACARELMEETNISVPKLTQFKTYGTVNRDPRHRTISIVFYAELQEPIQPQNGDDATKAVWHKLSELPELAFDHSIIIKEFCENIL